MFASALSAEPCELASTSAFSSQSPCHTTFHELAHPPSSASKSGSKTKHMELMHVPRTTMHVPRTTLHVPRPGQVEAQVEQEQHDAAMVRQRRENQRQIEAEGGTELLAACGCPT